MSSPKMRNPTEDRRLEDTGAPAGWRERRKQVERRIPRPEEVEMTDSQWATYFGTASEEAEREYEKIVAADVFDRARK
ncbi:MAG: hypothetical protein JNK92_00230 [Dechloromonas sp.]|nr:hypothetical protein [Dechloromonas sp.]